MNKLEPQRSMAVTVMLTLGSALGMALASPNACAQSSAAGNRPSAAAAANDSRGQLAEVIVTAERRSENLQHIAVSAIAASGHQLVEQGIVDGRDLQHIVPSLSFQPTVYTTSFVNIRGVGLQQTNPSSSDGVAFYLDNFFDPYFPLEVDAFYDLKDVEVLRGPQGTLVGSNADGGAIFINSMQPSLGRTGGYIQQTFGNYNEYRTEGALNLPISDQWAARVAFVHESRSSFTQNVGQQPPSGIIPGNNNQPGDVNYTSVRTQLLFQPNRDFRAVLKFEPFESSNDGPALKPDMVNYTAAISGFNPAAVDPYAASIQNKPFVIDYGTAQYFRLSGQRATLNADWHASHYLEIKSVTGWDKSVERDYDDIDASSAPSQQTEIRRQWYQTFTQEIDLLSPVQRSFSWVAGLYYLNASAPLTLSFASAGGPGPSLDVDPKHRNEAVFASATYRFAPRWCATVGGRYSCDQLPFIESLCQGFVKTCGRFSVSDSEPSWSLKLGFQVTPEILIYALNSSGYKSGGVNLHLELPGFTLAPPPFKPEVNLVDELGIKTTMLDRHLRLNVDGYESFYRNYQIQQFLGGVPMTQGPGRAQIDGIEMNAAGIFGSLGFNLAASYMHSKVSQNFTYLQNLGPPLTIVSGTEMPYAPKFMLNGGVQYSLPLGSGIATPRLQYQYIDSQYNIITHAVAPAPDELIPSHGTLDFSLTYRAAKHWVVEGYVRNLTNKTYISAILPNPQPAASWLLYGAPRQYGVRLKYDF